MSAASSAGNLAASAPLPNVGWNGTRRTRLGRYLALLCLSVSCYACAADATDTYGEPIPGPGSLLPLRVRHLSNVEYERSVAALLGVTGAARALPPDVRQGGFTNNVEQGVTPFLATQYATSAAQAAQSAVATHLDAIVPCAAERSSACARHFIAEVGKRALRRPLSELEQAALYDVFAVAASTQGFALGVERVLSTLLQSASFLYLAPGRGAARASGVVVLSQYELASELAYLVTGAPPDAALLAAADNAELKTPAQREAQFRRLVGKSSTRHQFRRFIKEWLLIDDLTDFDKDALEYPQFLELRAALEAETNTFIDAVFREAGASLTGFLLAGFSTASPELAQFYGFGDPGAQGRYELTGTGRVGILQQGSFLARHSGSDNSGPVQRGLTVLRRLLCESIPNPPDLAGAAVPPAPDPSRTTRERFAAHSTDRRCATCHAIIDPLGFVFENFDGAGARRSHEFGLAVDTRAAIVLDDAPLRVADSVELARRLAQSATAKQCFARQAFRFATGQSEPSAETAFLSVIAQMPPNQRDNLFEMLAAYVRSELFVKREVR